MPFKIIYFVNFLFIKTEVTSIKLILLKKVKLFETLTKEEQNRNSKVWGFKPRKNGKLNVWFGDQKNTQNGDEMNVVVLWQIVPQIVDYRVNIKVQTYE